MVPNLLGASQLAESCCGAPFLWDPWLAPPRWAGRVDDLSMLNVVNGSKTAFGDAAGCFYEGSNVGCAKSELAA
jgi:hypothetical protein